MKLPDMDNTELTGFAYYLVILLAVLFYVGWGLAYHTKSDGRVWTDIGVYAVVVVILGFGLIGTWLYKQISQEA